ncbi:MULTISPECIES: hypothetical protein [Streptomyces]|uniref:Galactose mutarotase n=1 Tax=Streptomyces flaveolus TaxID=67297 RepID=A0ABV3AFR4_9ACTN|nr:MULTISPECIES: hypothetical protein [Streptomyces]KMS92187.1 hypothetical protein ACZ91_06090 [Streptomyces regensis]KOG76072.1 hypothetical protein ADK77_00825 [Streptomyces antibioticus]
MLDVVTDPAHGGRWTSLRADGREWLWHRHAPERDESAPGDAFVDAGGLEECVPTVRGRPDHGDAWSRPWTRDGDTERVHCAAFTLTRTLRATPDGAEADYTLTAEPGFRFVWAAHALLDLSEHATLHMTGGATTRLFPEAAPLLKEPWPDGAPWVAGSWPAPRGLALDRLGPDDGTAVGAVVDTHLCCVHDGHGRLSLSVRVTADSVAGHPVADQQAGARPEGRHSGAGQPVSIALWRNLGGFPEANPYRSTGVEPMLGRVFDLADAGPGDAAEVPATGEVHWRLTLSTACRCP